MFFGTLIFWIKKPNKLTQFLLKLMHRAIVLYIVYFYFKTDTNNSLVLEPIK